MTTEQATPAAAAAIPVYTVDLPPSLVERLRLDTDKGRAALLVVPLAVAGRFAASPLGLARLGKAIGAAVREHDAELRAQVIAAGGTAKVTSHVDAWNLAWANVDTVRRRSVSEGMAGTAKLDPDAPAVPSPAPLVKPEPRRPAKGTTILPPAAHVAAQGGPGNPIEWRDAVIHTPPPSERDSKRSMLDELLDTYPREKADR